MKKYALLSVFDKSGIVEFAKTISSLGYTIISTGGTGVVLKENGIPIVPIQEVTGNPESFDGRMKTISFTIESGILYDRSKPSHRKGAKALGIKPIDLVVCNLYPFAQVIKKPKVTFAEAIENIDVGGTTMVRAAAKNFRHVIVVVDPNDYNDVSSLLHSNRLRDDFRKKLAAKAFTYISMYDAQIASFLTTEHFPNELTIPGRKVFDLRYGENPHQKASLYVIPNNKSPFEQLRKLSGRDLSLTNVLDINAGIESVRMFTTPCAVVIKHNTPCGIAKGENAKTALERAIQADPESAFGGVIVLNAPMNPQAAKVIATFKNEGKSNIDIVAVPGIDEDALELLRTTRKTMGVYTFGKIKNQKSKGKYMEQKWIDGGFVYQEADTNIEEGFAKWTIATKKKPTKEQTEQMKLAWKFIARIKSNAIIVVDKTLPMTRGIGTGQTSRVRSVRIALEQAGKYANGGILASDSFFPFDDSVKLAAEYGIGAIVQQGGSVNDKASIDAANDTGIPMVFTHRRAFWH